MGREEEIINERKRKIKELEKIDVNPYTYRFDKKQSVIECLKAKLKTKVKTAGRIMNIRNLGSLSFAILRDQTGDIQIVFQVKATPKEVFDFFKKYVDSGDFVGVVGEMIKTKTGELSIIVKKLEILTKSIRPLPSKWHGLKDKEERYRKRYLDLIMNPQVKEVFLKREKIIDTIRNFLKKREFLEVETPLLQHLYGGAQARPFVTNLHTLNIKMYLSISPELYLKKLITGGFERVFTICKNFRNEGIDKSHNPEFTMMEFYLSYADYNDVMGITEDLLSKIAKALHNKTEIVYQGKKINFKKPFRRIKMFDSIKKFADVDPKKLSAEEIDKIFEEKVQPNLIQPTFIIDYPKRLCPLTKEHRKDKNFVERFELFINGLEIANAYSELNDPIEQEKRLKEQIEKRKKSKDYDAHFEADVIDKDFVESMSYGMPPLGGVGIGIDRITTIFTDSPSIRDVILFPFMKPEK